MAMTPMQIESARLALKRLESAEHRAKLIESAGGLRKLVDDDATGFCDAALPQIKAILLSFAGTEIAEAKQECISAGVEFDT